MTQPPIGSVYCPDCGAYVVNALCGHFIRGFSDQPLIPEAKRLREARLALAAAQSEFEAAVKAYTRAGGE